VKGIWGSLLPQPDEHTNGYWEEGGGLGNSPTAMGSGDEGV
jgi:hypothetical protein